MCPAYEKRALSMAFQIVLSTSSVESSLESRTGWFKQAGFGVIIHWGPYAVPAYDDIASAKTRKIQNGSEWYYRRVAGPLNNYAPSGSQETRAYHQTHFPSLTYQNFAQYLTAENWNPEQLASTLASYGVKYVVMTSKHHDGFCMWSNGRKSRKSKGPWNAGETGPKRDVVGELAVAVRKYGMKFGIYYSLMEWDYSKALKKIDYVEEIVHRDLHDLQTRYQPDLYWFDGDWTRTRAEWKIDRFLERVYRESPTAVVNDRLGKGHATYAGNYQTFGDRYIPQIPLTTPWEHVMTAAYSWGFNAQQQDQDFKTQQQLYDLFREVRAKGGNILLNLGPDRQGNIDYREMAAVKYMGSLFATQ